MDQQTHHHLHALTQRLKDGDRAAARPLFDALWPPCVGVARAALGNDADANDAAQQALMTLFGKVASFDAERSVLGWALALVSWESRTILTRRRRRREDDVDTAGVAAVVVAPEVRLDRAADVAAMVQAFVQLDERDQQTLRAYLEGEAAGAPAARKQRQRAIDRLRHLVGLTPRAAVGDKHG